MIKRQFLKPIALCLFIAPLATGCSSNDDEESNPKYISIEAEPCPTTRAVNSGVTTTFSVGDRISVYAWTGGESLVPDTRVVDGTVNTLRSDNTWSPETPMLWKDTVTPHYFLGIYPARTVSDFTSDAFSITDDAEASDLLVAYNLTGITATNNPVSLVFRHMMARLNVNLNFRNQWDETPSSMQVKATAAKDCQVNYLAQIITPLAQSMVNIPSTTATSGYAKSFAGPIIPQTGFRTISVTINGTAYTYTHTEDIPLLMGKVTTINLIVGRDKIDLGNVSIYDWTDSGTVVSGEAVNE